MKLSAGYLLGEVVNSHVVAGLSLTETTYEPRLRLPAHTHEQAYFCFVLRGSYTENCWGGRSRLRCSSMLVFHPSHETHSDYFHTETRCFNILLDARWVERIHQHSKAADCSVDSQGGLLPRLAAQLYREYRRPDALSPLAIEGTVLEIIAETFRSSSNERTPPPWLKAAQEFLHENFSEQVTVAELARVVGVHPTHLAREFRKFYRCTIGEYVRERRTVFARNKLITSDAPLDDIGLASGFFDQSHFTRTFKRLTSMTPKEYRRAFRPR